MTTSTLRLGTTTRRLDLDAVHQGRAVECPLRPGLTVTVLPAAAYNPRYKKALQAWALRLPARSNGDAEKVEMQDHLTDPQFVTDALVASMTGIYSGDEPVEYTPDVGLEILADEANADVLGWIANEAYDYGLFYTEDVEAAAKN